MINEGGRCVGIITEADLVLSEEDADLHLPHYFQLFGGVVFLEPMSRFEERLRKAFASTAEDMMTPDPVTVEPSAPVEEAARMIARTRHNRLPVVEHGRLVGVVTRVDVLDALTNERTSSTCCARWPASTWPRSSATAPGSRAAAAPAALCAVVKADGYGHGAVPAARAAQAGGAAWLAVATAAEAAELRAAGVEGPLLVLGALSAEELDVALARGRGRRVLARGGGRGDRAPRRASWASRRACTSSSTPAWAGSARATPTRPRARSRRWPRAPALRLAGAFTHFATADEDDPAFLREQLARFTAWAADVRAAHPDVLVHAANSAATLAEPAARLDMVRCGVAIYGLDPFQRDPAEQGLEPALELRSYLAEVKPLRGGGERRLRPPLRRRARHVAGHDPDRLRRRLPARAHEQRRGRRRRPPRAGGRRGLDGQHHGRPRPGRAGPGRAGRAGGADRRRRCGPRSWPSGWGRSTTRSPAGSPSACRASYHRDGAPA